MSPRAALSSFRPKMRYRSSLVWNSVKRYEDGTSWLPEAREEISQLEELKQDWDSYGSLPIQTVAVKNSIRFMFELPPGLVPAPHISPTPGGGIGFHWRIGDRDLEIEFMPNGSIEFLKSWPGGDRESEEGVIQDAREYSVVRWLVGLT